MNDTNSFDDKKDIKLKEKQTVTINSEKSIKIKQSVSENIIRISSAKNIQTSFGNKSSEVKRIKSHKKKLII